MLNLGQANGFAACIDNTILMLNDIWNGLVNDVKIQKGVSMSWKQLRWRPMSI